MYSYNGGKKCVESRDWNVVRVAWAGMLNVDRYISNSFSFCAKGGGDTSAALTLREVNRVLRCAKKKKVYERKQEGRAVNAQGRVAQPLLCKNLARNVLCRWRGKTKGPREKRMTREGDGGRGLVAGFRSRYFCIVACLDSRHTTRLGWGDALQTLAVQGGGQATPCKLRFS